MPSIRFRTPDVGLDDLSPLEARLLVTQRLANELHVVLAGMQAAGVLPQSAPPKPQ